MRTLLGQRLVLPVLLLSAAVGGWVSARTQPTDDRKAPPVPAALPAPEPEFKGTIKTLSTDSKEDFPQWVKAPAGAPNVLLILLDDVGFGHTSTFGGPIPTPNITRLANRGLRYTQYHNTALCSPTRASLLTGRNHHNCATGNITEVASGYPGYHGQLPRACTPISEVLRLSGYNTAMLGKWHNTPDNETSAAGPFDRWPTRLGFETFYGFHGGDTNQWSPALYHDTVPVEPPHENKDYHFTTDIADRAAHWMRTQRSITGGEKPFFLYWAPCAAHAPHHVPKEWIDKFKGKYDQGWDKVREETLARQIEMGVVPKGTKLTPRPAVINAWADLIADQKNLYARMQEVYAAFLAHTDHELGKLLDTLDQTGATDNTLVILSIGDNGASSEGRLDGTLNELAIVNGHPETGELKRNLDRIDQLGGPLANNHYPAGWAHAGSTPHKWVKSVASHFGGTRNGLVVSWPKRIKDHGGIRSQFHHCIDVVPTILEAVGLPAPTEVSGAKQKPMDGVSMAYTFDDAKAATRRETQYFEMINNRAIYHKGWMASAFRVAPFDLAGLVFNPLDSKWELYHIDEDFSQANDLAAKHPEKLKELQELWMTEAKKNNVLPLQLTPSFDASSRPSHTAGRTKFTYYSGVVRVTEGSAPDVKNVGHSITADVVLKDGADGVLVTHGGRFGGYGLYLKGGKLHYVYNYLDIERSTVTSKDPLPAGPHALKMVFAPSEKKRGAGGTVKLYAGDKLIGEGTVPRTMPIRLTLDETFDVGEDCGTPVTEEYKVPFRFSGQLKTLTVELNK